MITLHKGIKEINNLILECIHLKKVINYNLHKKETIIDLELKKYEICGILRTLNDNISYEIILKKIEQTINKEIKL